MFRPLKVVYQGGESRLVGESEATQKMKRSAKKDRFLSHENAHGLVKVYMVVRVYRQVLDDIASWEWRINTRH